jgi:site-specific recombinase XerD
MWYAARMDTEQLIPPFREALAAYKTGYMAARNLAPRSRKEYEADVGLFLLFLQGLGFESFEQVGANHVEAYLAELDRQNLAGVTRRRKLTIIRTFFAWLKNKGELAANPAQAVAPPQQEDREPRVLSKEEYQRLLSVVQKPRDRAIIQLLLQTGIRLSEIQRLTLSDLDLPKRMTKDALGTMRILGKGRKTRTVLLNHKACEALAAWLAVRPEVETDALFVSSRHRPVSARQFQYLVGKYLSEAGIKDAGVHTLRHTFATHHIAMGTDLVTVQEFLGHSSLDTTKLYIGLAKKRQAQHIQDHAL